MTAYDVVVIGGGPGGYVCAIRAAQLGLKTACVEGRGKLGGTCLNVGCIPSKAMLHSSEMVHEAEGNFAEMGIEAKDVSVNMGKMQAYKQSVVDSNTSGIEFLFKKNKVDYIKGWGRIAGAGKVEVSSDDNGGGQTLEAKNIVIATGSEPSALPFAEIDQKQVVDSTGALEIPTVPGHLVVIGAGVIGLELGSVWKRLGAKVTVLEYLDHITPGMDAEVSKQFQKILTKQGLKFTLGAAVQSVKKGNKVKVGYKLLKDESEHEINADVVLVATGRRPYTNGLGLAEAGVETTERGQVKTDGHWRTNVPGIWAVGDVIDGPMLAHKAEEEGVAVAESIAGQRGHVNYGVIPSVIYTSPEVATVGETEEQLKARGQAYKVGKFPFMGNGRAKAHFASDGFVKVLADKDTDRVLGVHVIGPYAGDLIHEYCVAMEFGASAEDVARTCHAHPTFSEAMREAAMAASFGKAIHA
ncbi:MAG: dihydrolipoyl dehydrogenase [Rhodobacteraceae bacterium]|nr:dihydrolipoyl dehydrogenase [Paracoccaceae bacterium]